MESHDRRPKSLRAKITVNGDSVLQVEIVHDLSVA